MRPATHLVAIVLGIAGPVLFTLWSTTDYGPRSRAHYERAAAMDKRAEAVVGRFVKLAIEERQPARAVDLYYGPDVVEHGLPAGSSTGAERLTARGWSSATIKRKLLNRLGQKDLAVVQQLVFSEQGAPPHSEVDIFRVEDGKIVEHWEVVGASPGTGGAAG